MIERSSTEKTPATERTWQATINPLTIGPAITVVRLSRGEIKEQFAGSTNLSRVCVSHVEGGSEKPRLAQIRNVVDLPPIADFGSGNKVEQTLFIKADSREPMTKRM
ncbi:MAG TPA: hypothetical protein VE090_00590 [Methylomirabilota bacterium]|nr:hypothetical protein [Methylomirabilota bacterium]